MTLITIPDKSTYNEPKKLYRKGERRMSNQSLYYLVQQLYSLHYMMHMMGSHCPKPYGNMPYSNPYGMPMGTMPYGLPEGSTPPGNAPYGMPQGSMPDWLSYGQAGEGTTADIEAETPAVEAIAQVIRKGDVRAETPAIDLIADIVRKKDDLRAETPAVEAVAQIVRKKDDIRAETHAIDAVADIVRKSEEKPIRLARKDAVEVKISDSLFSPANLTINKGTAVVWSNGAEGEHSVTAEDGSFDSDSLKPGQTFSKILNTPGNYTYYSSKDPMLRGTIQVL